MAMSPTEAFSKEVVGGAWERLRLVATVATAAAAMGVGLQYSAGIHVLDLTGAPR